jgi:hypothetical protein
MSYGYSRSLVEANKRASIKSLGVAFGRFCIDNEIPATQVAEALGVSRMTIYNWFWGLRTPTIHLQPRVVKYIEYLKKRK